MKPLIALLILGSIATSASAAGTDMHLLTPEFSPQQEHSTPSRSTIVTRSRAIDISAVAPRGSVNGDRRPSWNELNWAKLVW